MSLIAFKYRISNEKHMIYVTLSHFLLLTLSTLMTIDKSGPNNHKNIVWWESTRYYSFLVTIECRYTQTFYYKLEDKFYHRAFLMRMITRYISDRFTKNYLWLCAALQYLFRVVLLHVVRTTFFSFSLNLLYIKPFLLPSFT